MTAFLETQGTPVGLLHCSVTSEPQATLVLSHKGLVLASSSEMGFHNSRLSISSAPNSLRVEIRDLEPKDSGKYQCVATNSLGNSSSTLDFHALGKTGPGQHWEGSPSQGPRSSEEATGTPQYGEATGCHG